MGAHGAPRRLDGDERRSMNAITQTLDRDEVARAVAAVVDPELGGVTIGDLGLVHDVRVDRGGAVVVELLPTFLGCPALALMAADVERAVRDLGVGQCTVVWRVEPSWDSSRITARGVEQLASLGIAVATTALSSPACPSCGSRMLRQINPVGATACRAVAWCGGCRSVIDVMGARRN